MLTVGPRHLALVAAFAALPLLAPSAAQADLLLTRAGTGTAGAVGDGSFAAAAQLNGPRGIARLADGSVLVADTGNNRVRKIAVDGTITTVAGSGVAGSAGDTGPALLAQVNAPRDVAVAPDGVTYYIADTAGNRIRRVDASGTITTFAGTGTANFSGDGTAATLATLNTPSGLGVTAGGAVLIADTTNNRIRQVSGGTIATVAGSGAATSTGDGSPALLATINAPQDVSAVAGGGFLVADTVANKIRRVDGAGTITTVAGTGTACATAGALCGDYGPAGLALLNAPASVTADASGSGFLIADTGSNRVRRVSASGTITTLAGSGAACATPTLLCGDAGPASLAALNAPRAAIDLPDGSLLFADSATNRLRARIPDAAGPAGPAGATGLPGANGLAGADGADGAAGSSGSTGPGGPGGPAGTPGADGRVLVPAVTASFAATKLTGRTARATVLRIVLTAPAVVSVRVKCGTKTVATRKLTFRTPGRKQIPLGKLKAATYAVTLTATDGASQSVDRAALRIIPGR
ncbi:tail fiber protein [Baekduia alba]|uniref:hypothetical protein n=1 Tax=Baekduia alba TaxID=2997333 RepID=UPI00233FE17B|nr:hypothetical protein [Baekduia alba]WCB93251.1 tail fiber protein [Baekduia alba]